MDAEKILLLKIAKSAFDVIVNGFDGCETCCHRDDNKDYCNSCSGATSYLLPLYGHIHNGRDTRPFSEYTEQMRERGFPYRCANVGCMLHDYTPATLDDLGLRNNE